MKKWNCTGRKYTCMAAMGLTAALLFLLITIYIKYDRTRTLRIALEKAEGDPILFSEQSGFYEDGFTLRLERGPGIPEDIEIRYTTDGDEPTPDSPLYGDGIDLAEIAAAALEAEDEAAGQEKESPEPDSASLTDGGSGAADQGKTEPDAEALKESGQGMETASGSQEDQAGETTDTAEASRPSIEEERTAWRQEKAALTSGKGVTVETIRDGICVIPVRACLIQGEDKSPVQTRTYVIGKDIKDRYGAYVACITTDSYNLFDYDDGIMVRGSHYQEDLDKGTREDRSGNFYHTGQDWIRDGHITLFSPDGTVLLEEDGGLSVSGYSSRILPTRSLRMEASTARGSSEDVFRLNIFSGGTYAPQTAHADQTDPAEAADLPDQTDDADLPDQLESADRTEPAVAADLSVSKKPEEEIRKIRFRTHGTPRYRIRSVRGEFVRILTDECGFPGLPEYRLGVCYLNGEFYTLCDITPGTTNEFLSGVFGLKVPEAIEKYEGNDYSIFKASKILPLLNADLTAGENCDRLEEEVDMDNYLFYYALEVVLNNADWPFNNVTMWRYLGERDPENPYTDGRFRFVLDDMDQILTNNLHSAAAQWSTEVFDYLMKDEKSTFHRTMQCEKYRDTFLTYVDDLLRTCCEPDHACAILDELYGEMKKEYLADYGEAFWEEMEEAAEITKQNVREKEELFRADVTKYLGLTDRCPVQVEAGDGITVTWNSITNTPVLPGGTWSGAYYSGTSITYTARPAEGYRFVGWEINGRQAGARADTDTADGTDSDGSTEDGAQTGEDACGSAQTGEDADGSAQTGAGGQTAEDAPTALFSSVIHNDDGSACITLHIPAGESPVILRALAEPAQ